VQFNDILVQPHQPPASGPAEAASSGLWSGFNNVMISPFRKRIMVASLSNHRYSSFPTLRQTRFLKPYRTWLETLPSISLTTLKI
jgi:hypothetical protein